LGAGFAAQLLANALVILPVFAPIVVGFLLKRSAFIPDAFWPQAERITYFVLLPALIANAIATGGLALLEAGPLLLALGVGLIATAAALFGLKRVLRISGASFASLFHGCIRPNGYMGIATGLAVLGPAALSPISLVVAVWVPLGLVLAIIAFSSHSDSSSISVRELATRLIRNPLVASVAVGITLNGVGAGPFLVEVPLLDVFGRAAVAMGLLAVGAGIDPKMLRASGAMLFGALALGLLGMPAVMLGVGLGFGLEGVALATLVIFAAMPTSPSGFVMASQMGGDAPLMAAIISAQTLASILTIALVVTLLL
jgi:predicted permease